MPYKIDVNFEEIMDIYSENHTAEKQKSLAEVYEFANQKHAGMTRGTGEPFIYHPMRVAKMIAEWGFGSTLIKAALLHDVVEDCNTSLEEIERLFGKNVAEIVDAVTSLSDKDFVDHTLTKAQMNILSDARLQKKMNAKALCIKIADRIDNLSTIDGVKEYKRIPKAEHTREIIIPIAKIANAYRFVDILEALCFQVEHPKKHEEIEAGYKRLITENGEKCQESLDYLQTVFHPHFNSGIPELEKYRDYIVNFIYNPRSTISIYRQISHEANNIEKDLPLLLNKENIALYDLVLILKDELMDNVSFVHPDDVFFQYFDKTLSKKGFHLVRRCRTTHKDSYYYLIADETNNLYRFFVRTEQEYKRYMLGNIIDTDCELSIDEINEIDPRETYNEKIKVFCRNGSFMMIEKGATVLDFAFHIDKELGYHFGHAYLDDSKTSLAANTKLNEGDMITIVPDENIKPDITWFRDVKTLKSVNYLVHYFQKIMGM